MRRERHRALLPQLSSGCVAIVTPVVNPGRLAFVKQALDLLQKAFCFGATSEQAV